MERQGPEIPPPDLDLPRDELLDHDSHEPPPEIPPEPPRRGGGGPRSNPPQPGQGYNAVALLFFAAFMALNLVTISSGASWGRGGAALLGGAFAVVFLSAFIIGSAWFWGYRHAKDLP